jgi:hypothetical protein
LTSIEATIGRELVLVAKTVVESVDTVPDTELMTRIDVVYVVVLRLVADHRVYEVALVAEERTRVDCVVFCVRVYSVYEG